MPDLIDNLDALTLPGWFAFSNPAPGQFDLELVIGDPDADEIETPFPLNLHVVLPVSREALDELLTRINAIKGEVEEIIEHDEKYHQSRLRGEWNPDE